MRIQPLLLALLATCPLLADIDGDIEAKRRAIAALRADLDPLVAPLLVTGADMRAHVNRSVIEKAIQAIAALPPDKRKFRLQSTGQITPLIEIEQDFSHLACGYRLELAANDGLVADFSINSLALQWLGTDSFAVLGDYYASATAKIRFHVKGPPCPIYEVVLTCSDDDDCDCALCGGEGHCCDETLELVGWERCSDCQVGGGFGSSVEVHGERGYDSQQFRPEPRLRPLTADERRILAAVPAAGATPAALAAQLGLSQADVQNALDLYKDAGLVQVQGSSTFLPTDSGSEAVRNGALGLILDVQQPVDAAPPIDFMFGLQHIGQVRLTQNVPLPKGRLMASYLELAADIRDKIHFDEEQGITAPDGWPRTFIDREYAFKFMPSKTDVLSSGWEVRGATFVDYSDLIAWRRFLRIHVIDVGYGDAIWIQSPGDDFGNGERDLIIDAGPDEDDLSYGYHTHRALIYARTLGLRPTTPLEYVILTHPHADHFSGVPDMLRANQTNQVILPRSRPLSLPYWLFRWRMRAAARKVTVRSLKLSDTPVTLPLSSGATLEILRAASSGGGIILNKKAVENASVVARLKYGKASILLMGDALSEVEDNLLRKFGGNSLRSAVLKVGAHGRASASSQPFLQAVQPRIAVISSGPSLSSPPEPEPATLQRLAATGATVLRTDAGETDPHAHGVGGNDIFIGTDGVHAYVYHAVRENGKLVWKYDGDALAP